MQSTNPAGYTVTTATIPVVRFDPRQEGLGRFLGSTEAMIMGSLWDAPAITAWTVKKMHRDLFNSYEHDVAYTTVMTTITRLWEKGLVSRKKDGLAYNYMTRCSQSEFEEIQLRSIVASIGPETLAELLESMVQA
jgi:predicted transcriptional regulator